MSTGASPAASSGCSGQPAAPVRVHPRRDRHRGLRRRPGADRQPGPQRRLRLRADPRRRRAVARGQRPADAWPSARSTAPGAIGSSSAQPAGPQDDPAPRRPRPRAEPRRWRAAVPDARPRLAVFLHGLCETDDAWRLRATGHRPYGDRLESELGYTSLYVRYNSGLHISANGRRLAELMDELVAAWPVEVAEIALIGHSMGGLVARSACHYAPAARGASRCATCSCSAPRTRAPRSSWRPTPPATPRPGCPRRAVRHAAEGPRRRGQGPRLRLRGRRGLAGPRPRRLLVHNTGTVVPFLTSANHYFVSATLTRDADARLGRLVGDLLVLRPSAWSHEGRGERLSSRSTTTATSVAPTTSTCSTTPRSAARSRPG